MQAWLMDAAVTKPVTLTPARGEAAAGLLRSLLLYLVLSELDLAFRNEARGRT